MIEVILEFDGWQKKIAIDNQKFSHGVIEYAIFPEAELKPSPENASVIIEPSPVFVLPFYNTGKMIDGKYLFKAD